MSKVEKLGVRAANEGIVMKEDLETVTKAKFLALTKAFEVFNHVLDSVLRGNQD